MILLPPEKLSWNGDMLDRIDDEVASLYRLIVFSPDHRTTDLLSRYMEAIHHLRDVLSIKNAQQEAQSEEEARTYLAHLREGLKLIVREIADNRPFATVADLFMLFRTIAPEAAARHPNRFRTTTVQVGAHIAPPPEAVEGLITQLLEVLPTIPHPALRAAYLHHELVRIHPFVDGNGRISRMAKNWMLMYALYPPIFIYGGSDQRRYIQTLHESFQALAADPETLGPATRTFFRDELQRIKASANFILARMKKNPKLPFGNEDLIITPNR